MWNGLWVTRNREQKWKQPDTRKTVTGLILLLNIIITMYGVLWSICMYGGRYLWWNSGIELSIWV